MGKKLIGTIGTLVMLLGTIGLFGCDESLADYKADARAEIEAYAEERKNNYSEDNWTAVCGIVESGKRAVDEAENKAGVDMAVNAAKEEMEDLKIQVKQGVYSTDDNWATITLYGDNQFTFSVMVISSLPMGNYSIKNDKLVLSHSDNYESIFNIADGQLVFVGSTENGIFVEDGIVKVGTIFHYSENAVQELKQGTYSTDDGLSNVTLFDDNKYIFNRHIGTSYRPTGSYAIANGKLTLYIENKAEFVFDIVDEQLVFVSGQLAESLVEVGTIFRLSN